MFLEATIYLVVRAALWKIEERLNNRLVAIYSDNQVVLTGLSRPLITSRIVQKLRNCMNSISKSGFNVFLDGPGSNRSVSS